MNNSKFLKAPLSHIERERKAEEFLNFSSRNDVKEVGIKDEKQDQLRVFKKEAIKALALRFPISLAEDISEISALTSLSVNSICIELLRPAAKQKLKELKN